MSEFNLIFYHRLTGKKMLAKRLPGGEYRLQDPETKETVTISTHLLFKTHKGDPGNFKAGMVEFSLRPKRLGRSGRSSKAFLEYLNGTA